MNRSPSKRRVHFNGFMLDVHKRIHQWRKEDATGRGDPIAPLAAALSYEATLLCFDEFQVTDVADAVRMPLFCFVSV